MLKDACFVFAVCLLVMTWPLTASSTSFDRELHFVNRSNMQEYGVELIPAQKRASCLKDRSYYLRLPRVIKNQRYSATYTGSYIRIIEQRKIKHSSDLVLRKLEDHPEVGKFFGVTLCLDKRWLEHAYIETLYDAGARANIVVLKIHGIFESE